MILSSLLSAIAVGFLASTTIIGSMWIAETLWDRWYR